MLCFRSDFRFRCRLYNIVSVAADHTRKYNEPAYFIYIFIKQVAIEKACSDSTSNPPFFIENLIRTKRLKYLCSLSSKPKLIHSQEHQRTSRMPGQPSEEAAPRTRRRCRPSSKFVEKLAPIFKVRWLSDGRALISLWQRAF